MMILNPDGNRPDKWVLRGVRPDVMVVDWSVHPPRHVNAISLTWDPLDTRQIKFISQDDPEASDYRLIREKIIEQAALLEQDDSRPFKTYMVGAKKFAGYNDLVFKTRTYLGALVSYMNWLDTQNIPLCTEEPMWDQLDLYYLNIGDYDSIEDLADEFEEYNNDILKEWTEPEVITFPGPQPDLIKVVRS